jgi:hypothetical protein
MKPVFSLFHRKRPARCDFSWVTRRYIRVAFSTADGELVDWTHECILAAGHEGPHQSASGARR